MITAGELIFLIIWTIVVAFISGYAFGAHKRKPIERKEHT